MLHKIASHRIAPGAMGTGRRYIMAARISSVMIQRRISGHGAEKAGDKA